MTPLSTKKKKQTF